MAVHFLRGRIRFDMFSANFETVRMKQFTAVIERCTDTGLYVGYVPGLPGAHTQAESLDELQKNLEEVIALILDDGEPRLESEFIGTQTISIAG